MSHIRKPGALVLLGFIGSLLLAPALSASGATGIYVNGVEMTPRQSAILQQTLGFGLPPGQYLVQGGCIAHLDSGRVLCAQPPQGYAAGEYTYGGDPYSHGGGYGYNDGAGGAWYQRGSDYSGGYSVGGDGSGCVYTPDWSNC